LPVLELGALLELADTTRANPACRPLEACRWPCVCESRLAGDLRELRIGRTWRRSIGSARVNTHPVADRFLVQAGRRTALKAEHWASCCLAEDLGNLSSGRGGTPPRAEPDAAQAMEGCDATPEGAPSDLTVRAVRAVRGAARVLIWFEATAVVANGRPNPSQLFITPASESGFRHLVDVTRETRAALRSVA